MTSTKAAAARPASRAELVALAHRLGSEVLAPAADAVDRDARFPTESIEAMKREQLLSVFIPVELGGGGCSITDLSAICQAFGQYCASSAMVFAMHQIQVACLVRHGRTPYLQDYLRQIVRDQLLLASATTEAGVGGDVRSSVCSVEREGNRFRIAKNAPVISYAESADAILATARRAVDSASSDQVITLVRKQDYTLERTSGWNTLGMRGTCSNGYQLKAEAPIEQVVPQPYAEISSQTMLPTSHVVWTSLWLGIATDAVNRARAYIRAEARKKPGTTPPGALRLAEVVSVLQTMRTNVDYSARDYEELFDNAEELSSIGFALRMNNLKIASSQLVVDIVGQALMICGITGYRHDSKYSLTRHIRDAYGAALMINNDRIYGANASMLLVHKDD